MRSKPCHLLSGLLIVSATVACTYTLPLKPPPLDTSDRTTSLALEGNGDSTPNETRLAVARRNSARARYLIDDEYKLYGTPHQESQYPEFGIALSGGGSRSAAFSLGVLAALRADQLLLSAHQSLSDVDIISSVSGGGYTNYYLAVNGLPYAGFNYQSLLEPGPPLNTAASNGLTDAFKTSWSAITPVLCLPFRWAFATVPTESPRFSCLRSNYFVSLGGAYDSKSFLHSANLSDVAVESSGTSRRAFPILSATVYVSDDRHCSKNAAPALTSLYTSVFEMSPVKSGSEWVGYEPTQPQTFWPPSDKGFQIEFGEAASTSGAALDQRTKWWCPWIHAFGYDLGLSLDRYYGVRRTLTDGSIKSGSVERAPLSIALVDGGETENLGAYPLVKRLTRRILIVDAEFDPEQKFDAYWCLKTKLETQGIKLSIVGIEEQLGDRPKQCNGLVKSTQALARTIHAHVVKLASARQFAYTGYISGLSRLTSLTGGDETDSSPLRVTYVKLGMPSDELVQFENYLRNLDLGARAPKDLGNRIINFVKGNRANFTQNGVLACTRGFLNSVKCPFPSVETTNQNLGIVQYYAYYFLGRYAMETYVAGHQGKLFVD